MILVRINKDKYKYDIHSLVKAFYSKEDVSVLTDEEIAKKEFDENDILFKIEIFLEEEKGEISMKIIRKDGSCAEAKTICATSEEGADSSTNGTSASLSTPKNALKQMMYRELSKEIGHELPWGSLTGIRPTRIPMQMLEAGKQEDDIKKYMQNTFFVSDEKTDLAYNIAIREKKILDDINYRDGYSIYLGIPFCPTTCLYCSFTSFPIVTWSKKVDDYIECLKKEIDFVAENFKGKTVNSVYIGGGTPTTLSPDQMTRLISYLREKIDLSECREFTVESGRPDSITREKLRAMKNCGVDRISVNPQTMSDETLKRIGRQHTVAQFIDAYKTAREEGFDNINMDIILGLPGETEEDVKHTMSEIEKLSPDDLTVHSLSVKRGSRLAEHIRNNGYFVAGDTGSMMKIAAESAKRMGLSPYYLYRQKNISGNLENTGYAREGKAGIYNILMMEEVQSIVALGAGTVTKRVYGDGRIERCDNVKDITLYMNNIEEMIERKRVLFSF
ncbi:coproporphyrinogen dehydrogenase HemZ [Butyrivibrio sp. LC3010]|uniref:coproporphyrinogen dehydrogenase HemZ n=1 Tax=Butyrivibrio sp. LC3010 TaxID=1280680 RepID=UPI0003FFC33C|nr:coproporphyrinogen dehydrogenase HemZ [Butyrivibrio sp. LC3010]